MVLSASRRSIPSCYSTCRIRTGPVWCLDPSIVRMYIRDVICVALCYSSSALLLMDACRHLTLWLAPRHAGHVWTGWLIKPGGEMFESFRVLELLQVTTVV
jgi:hypothetical protein